MKLKYKSLQTIKHALQYYIQREDATEDDLKSENSLLEKIEKEIDRIKAMYRIA